MTKVTYSYQGIQGVEIPEQNFLGLYEPALVSGAGNTETQIADALDHPIGSSALEERIEAGSKVLILSDDNTRATPADKLLAVLLPRLRQLGIRQQDISILMALGTHRPMSERELTGKLGARVVREYNVENHLWDSKEDHVYFGKTSRQIDVYGNRRLKEADFVIGLGHIVPHRVAGFSGGGKIAMPGVCNGETTGKTHWISALVSGKAIMGRRDNPVREQIDESARLLGLDYILNVVQDSSERVVGVFSGDPVAAHRAGCQLAKQVYGVNIPKADIVITDSYPADIELWQAAKGIYTSELIVNDGGMVILVTPCPEGVATTHPEIEQFGYQPLREVETLIKEQKLTELSVAAHLVHVGRVIRENATGIMVSPGIPHDIQKQIGFIPADSLATALAYALEKKGDDASVVAVRNAGELLPVVET